MEDHFDLDQEFDIVELEPRGAASPDGQTIVIVSSGSGSTSSGSGGSGGSTLGSGGSGGGSGT